MFTFSNLVVLLAFWQMFIAFINFITNPVLKKTTTLVNDKVSILIPARNEEKNILTLLNSIKNQNYENFEVIVLDDHSEDQTHALVSDFCNQDPRFSITEGKNLPPNWLGKNWACHQLAQKATGSYLLFLDADTEIGKELVNSSVTYMKNKKLKLLSLFPDQTTITLGEKIIVPFINHVLLSLLVIHFVKIPYFSSLSAANGQFMLFEAENYKTNLWHDQVKENVAEDVTIVRKMKKQRYKVSALLANGLIKCRMYKSLSECISGFEKNLLLIFGNSILFLLLYLTFGVLNVFLVSDKNHFFIVLFIALLSKLFTSLLSNQNIFINLILYPLQIFFFTFIAIKAIYKKLTKKDIIWKGRKLILE